MKKLLMAMVLMPLMAMAATEKVGDITWSYSISGGEATVEGADPCTGAITIPSTLGGCPVTSIGEGAFYGCRGLTSVTIPLGVMGIGNDAFFSCEELSSVSIPQSVTSIGVVAFYDTKLVHDHVDGLLVMNGCLIGCKGTVSGKVAIPDGVRLIADGAFSEWFYSPGPFGSVSGITSITIPPSVTSIGEIAFADCGALESFTVAPENAVFSSQDGVLYNKTKLELVCFPKRKTGAVSILPGVKSIGVGALVGCEGLTSLSIPSSVTSIGEYAFENCGSLKSFTVAPENTAFSSQDGILFNKAKTKVICCPGGKTGVVSIPSGVKSIGSFAFACCAGLTSVTIPSGVTSIGARAFILCEGLTSMTIPSGVTRIENSTFSSCSKLKSVTIPFGVTSIGDGAFSNCSGLTSVTIPSSVTSIGAMAFVGCDGLTTIYASPGDTERMRNLLSASGLSVGDVEFVESATTYMVSFNANGGSCSTSSRQYQSGTTLGTLPTATRAGYEFLGWFTAAGGGTQVTAETVVTADVTFYAHWKRIGSTADEEVIAGEKVTIETGLVGYKASGLPKGLSYNAKTGKITGTTKSVTAGAVEVVFTKAGKEDVKMTFEVRAEDVSVGCAALATGSFQSGVMGAAGGIPIETFCETGVKSVSVTKLPSGMKYDSKNRLITGAPNKAGNYEVVLTVTTTSGAKETVKIPVSVTAMPVMAVGKFDGFVSVGEDNLGTFTLTTTDAGKLTAKAITAAGTVSFSGTCWDAVENGVYRATLTTKKGEKLTLMLDSTAAWDADQLSGEFTTAAIAETKKTAAVPPRIYSVSAQKNAFGKTWYFAATGDETTGWKLAYTEDTKGAALTVTLKADGSTSIAGKLPNGTDTKGKAVTIKVSASGSANVGGLKESAILADFAPVLTVNKVKTVLAITTNLWFDRKNEVGRSVGAARFVK